MNGCLVVASARDITIDDKYYVNDAPSVIAYYIKYIANSLIRIMPISKLNSLVQFFYKGSIGSACLRLFDSDLVVL